jgi:hypothetical protein
VVAAASGVFGLLVGAVLIPIVNRIAIPVLRRLRPGSQTETASAHH